jgi:hypothetical protein
LFVPPINGGLMRRLVLLLSFVLVTSSLALSVGKFGFGAHANAASLNIPDPLKSVYGAGFGGGLHVDYRLGIVSIRFNGDYTSFSADENAWRDVIFNEAGGAGTGVDKASIGVSGARIGILSFALNGKFSLPNAAISPYLIVGLGSGTLSMSDLSVTYQGAPVTGITAAETVTKFLSNAGIGVDFSLGSLSLFVETKYTWIFTENEASTYLPVTVGITF